MQVTPKVRDIDSLPDAPGPGHSLGVVFREEGSQGWEEESEAGARDQKSPIEGHCRQRTCSRSRLGESPGIGGLRPGSSHL